MKIIKYLYEPILELQCSTCMEEHTMRFDICKDFKNDENHEALYVDLISEYTPGFFERLKTFFHYRKNWKKYINGKEQTYNGITLDITQIREMYPILIDKLLKYETITLKDVEEIESWDNFPTIEYDKDGWAEQIIFNGNDIVLSIEAHESNGKNIIQFFTLGYRFYDEMKQKDINRRTWYYLIYKSKAMISNYEGFIDYNNTKLFLSVLYYLIKNMNKETNQLNK